MTRERALEAALRLCLPHAERIAATTPTTPTRAQRQVEAATAATNARVALALPPDGVNADMLAALEYIAARQDGVSRGTAWDQLVDVRETARAAIAKATGEK